MDNRIRRIRVGASLLSAWFITLVVLFVLLVVNTIIAMLTEFSPIDSMPSAIGHVLSNALINLLMLVMLVGTFFVTTGSERVKSIAAVNITRLLSRGFCVLFILLQGTMLLDELWGVVFDQRLLASTDDAVWWTLEEMTPVLWVPWAGFAALYYPWLYFEMGILTREKARSHAKLLICGGVSIGIVMLIEANSSISSSAVSPRPSWIMYTHVLLSLVVLVAAVRACSLIIGLPYTMKKKGIGAASVTADRSRP